MPQWLEPYRDVLLWLGTLSLVSLLLSAIVIPLVLVRLPADWFLRERTPPRERTPARVLLWLVRNLAGTLLVLAGIAMLALPGQGLLTVLLGLMVMEFPKKRELERWLVRRRGVCRAIDWLRRRAGRPPLET